MAQSKTQPQAPGTWSPLRHRVFLAIWLASIISSIGSQLQQVGAAWLMTSLAPSPEMVALVTALSTLPILLFSLPAGALADILDRRLVLLGAQILMLVASGVLAALAFAGLVTPAFWWDRGRRSWRPPGNPPWAISSRGKRCPMPWG